MLKYLFHKQSFDSKMNELSFEKKEKKRSKEKEL
jgi:hypothetical protein